MESITRQEAAPAVEAYTPLSEHQEQTPTVFFGGKPVLYAHFTNLDALVNPRDAAPHAALFKTTWTDLETPVSAANGVNGSDSAPEPSDHVNAMKLASHISAFVGSDALVLASSPSSSALRIPYTAIGLHATQRIRKSSPSSYTSLTSSTSGAEIPALYLQLDPAAHLRANVEVDDEEYEGGGPVDVLLMATEGDAEAAIREMFEALSKCADLHPDPDQADSDDGEAASMSMPGATGWITAENAHQFADQFEDADEEGSGELGLGAGNVRGRDDDDDGNVDSDEATKWQRTG